MAEKARLHLFLLLLIVLSIIAYFAIHKVRQIQRLNDYHRCKVVVSMAKKTGKMVDKHSTKEICQYHLE